MLPIATFEPHIQPIVRSNGTYIFHKELELDPSQRNCVISLSKVYI